MAALWAHPDGLSARQVVEALSGQPAAITTVLTVLDRLRAKGLVSRSDGPVAGAYVFTAAHSQSDHVVSGMLGSLTASSDRHAALMHFAGRLDPEDAEVLRTALAGRTGLDRP